MIEGFPWPVWTSVMSVSFSVNVYFFVLLMRGRLMVRREHERALDAETHEKNEWRAESRIKDQQIAEKDEQLRHLAEVGRVMNAVLRAIQHGRTSDLEVPE
jgi:hypothetical protein